MAKYRQNRVNDAVALEVAQILREIKDPRVSAELITVCSAEVTADLKYAKIYYSAMGGDAAECAKGLKSAAGFVRSQLAKRLNLRTTPEIHFIPDESVKRGADIAAILHGLDIKPLADDDIDDEADK